MLGNLQPILVIVCTFVSGGSSEVTVWQEGPVLQLASQHLAPRIFCLLLLCSDSVFVFSSKRGACGPQYCTIGQVGLHVLLAGSVSHLCSPNHGTTEHCHHAAGPLGAHHRTRLPPLFLGWKHQQPRDMTIHSVNTVCRQRSPQITPQPPNQSACHSLYFCLLGNAFGSER